MGKNKKSPARTNFTWVLPGNLDFILVSPKYIIDRLGGLYRVYRPSKRPRSPEVFYEVYISCIDQLWGL